MTMKIQYENSVILKPCLLNHMPDADVRSPCGEFAKRQGIIHFVFAEPRKLRKLFLSEPLATLGPWNPGFLGSFILY